jgi:hypothetical protein
MWIGSRGIPYLAKNERDMGHPLIRGTMRFFDRRILTLTLKPHSFSALRPKVVP